jgi:hypothetical protein
MVRKIRTITARYIPTEWGVKIEGKDTQAWVRLVRMDDSSDYAFYGRDADCYEEFEREGFAIYKKVKDLSEAKKWIEQEVMGE